MKLSEKYPYQDVFEKCLNILIDLKYLKLLFPFNREGENVSEYSDLEICWQKIMRNDKNNATVKKV